MTQKTQTKEMTAKYSSDIPKINEIRELEAEILHLASKGRETASLEVRMRMLTTELLTII